MTTATAELCGHTWSTHQKGKWWRDHHQCTSDPHPASQRHQCRCGATTRKD